MALSKDAAENEDNGSILLTCLCICTILLWLRQTYIEVVQAKNEGWRYLCSFWNFVDITGLLLAFVVYLMTGVKSELLSFEVLRVFAAFASCFTLIKLFDWLRLFEQTAFYVLLLEITMQDIKYFFLLVLATLMMFGVPLLMLDGSSKDGFELIDGTFNFWIIDLMYNQYLLALGEFGLDNFGEHPQAALVYFFFVLATFFSQLTMLNMLIAIMGDSFAKVFENQAVNGTRMKLAILGDLSSILP